MGVELVHACIQHISTGDTAGHACLPCTSGFCTAHGSLPLHAGVSAAPKPAIGLSDKALVHLQKLRSQSGSDQLLLRIGVKSGGCSGMSYLMDFEQEANVKAEDSIIDYEGQFRLVCDSKSLLYLFGMQLDYSDALIGGGFQFHNPNAQDTCGCGKSFGV